jgi:hypothetical protein
MSELNPLIQKIIEVAKEYRRMYQRPLGSITGDIGEHIVAHQFQLELVDYQTPSFDAISKSSGRKIQIKSRIFSRPKTDTVGTVKEGGFDDLLVASFKEYLLMDVYLVDSKTLEANLSVKKDGAKRRDPHLYLIQRIGKSLEKSDDGWFSI